MASTRVKLTNGMAQLLRDDGVRAMLHRHAEPVLSAAIAGAPVQTGAYRDSLRIMDGTTDRAVVRVGAGVAYAAVVEASTGNLARALDAAGGS